LFLGEAEVIQREKKIAKWESGWEFSKWQYKGVDEFKTGRTDKSGNELELIGIPLFFQSMYNSLPSCPPSTLKL
jgi:hypothetical protein